MELSSSPRPDIPLAVSVKITRIACQQCGADLDVSADIRFVTCRYCSSRLEIVHEPTVAYSKQLEDLAARTEEVERELRMLRLHRELDALDESWESFRRAVSSRSRDGRLVEPDSTAAASLPGLAAAGASVMIAVIALSGNHPLLLLAMIPVLGLGVLLTRTGFRKVDLFRRTRARYLQRRTQLSGEIHGLGKSGRLPPMKRSGTMT